VARARNKLSARAVAAFSRPGKQSDGGGLYLRIDGREGGMRRHWVFRFVWGGAIREMGLGAYPKVSLAEARQARDAAERLVREGQNPIAVRESARKAGAGKPTFGHAAAAFIAAKAHGWCPRHVGYWRRTLESYASPIWDAPVDEVDTEAVLGVLQPIWQVKPETAQRLRGRIEAVLDAERARGHITRNEANPARWRGHLDKLLPKARKLTRGHLAAMPYAEVPAFLANFRERPSIAAMALKFLVLTAARSGEVLGAAWAEIDFTSKLWTIPAKRMKAGREHRVPLSRPAIEILEKLEAKTGEFIFPGQRAGKPLSSMALEMVLRRMKIEGATVHGFRSAFRDWAGDCTSFPREVAEAALAHVAGDATERAYRRGDALEKRCEMMDAWAQYLEPGKAAKVIPLTKRR
jgi:integrase